MLSLEKDMSHSLEDMRNQIKFHWWMTGGLVISLFIVACLALKKDQIVVIVPPNLNEQVWLNDAHGLEAYIDSWIIRQKGAYRVRPMRAVVDWIDQQTRSINLDTGSSCIINIEETKRAMEAWKRRNDDRSSAG